MQAALLTPTRPCCTRHRCSEKLDVLDHYVAWRQTHDMPAHASGADGPFSFCTYPFLLNPRAKSKLLHTEARIQMDQTVAQSRLEQASGNNSARGPRPEDEPCVVPSEKARVSAALRGAELTAAGGRAGAGPPNSARRRGQGGLRWLLNTLRTAEGASAGSSMQDDERRMMGRQANGTSESAGPLWKQGSLNLPHPEESGFPATHPDMCILRIRRNHLLEVRPLSHCSHVSLLCIQPAHKPTCLPRALPHQDALNEIARQRPRDLFKPLRVHFIGEDGIDAGGVKKEFFQVCSAATVQVLAGGLPGGVMEQRGTALRDDW